MIQRGGRGSSSQRGGRGRGRPPAAYSAPSSPQLKACSKSLLSESFLRFPRPDEIQLSDFEDGDDRSSLTSSAEIRCYAILDGKKAFLEKSSAFCVNCLLGIDFALPLPSLDYISQLLRDRFSSSVHVVEFLKFRSEFCAESEVPCTRAAVVKFENASICASG